MSKRSKLMLKNELIVHILMVRLPAISAQKDMCHSMDMIKMGADIGTAASQTGNVINLCVCLK